MTLDGYRIYHPYIHYQQIAWKKHGECFIWTWWPCRVNWSSQDEDQDDIKDVLKSGLGDLFHQQLDICGRVHTSMKYADNIVDAGSCRSSQILEILKWILQFHSLMEKVLRHLDCVVKSVYIYYMDWCSPDELSIKRMNCTWCHAERWKIGAISELNFHVPGTHSSLWMCLFGSSDWLTWQSPETSRRDSKPSIFGNSNIFGECLLSIIVIHHLLGYKYLWSKKSCTIWDVQTLHGRNYLLS